MVLAPESYLNIGFSMDDPTMRAQGSVVRCDPGQGLAIKFKEVNREERASLQKIIEFVDRSSKLYDNTYLSRFQKK
jgi:hypothetical protein